jgi:iron complex outermembrane receptor protein
LQFEAILSRVKQDRRQVVDFDGTEFIFTTDDSNDLYEGDTVELHLSGSALDGRIGWLAGYYSLKEDLRRRVYRWGMWEFVHQTPGVMTNGSTAPSQLNLPYLEYVRQTAYVLNLNGFSGGNLLTADTATPTGTGAQARYPWMQNISNDTLTRAVDDDEAWFGEATFGVTEKIEIVVGARVSDKSGRDERYQALEAFRTADPDVAAQGDKFAGTIVATNYDAEKPEIDTYKFSVSYEPTADIMVYGSYAEGYTSAENTLLTVSAITVTPPGATRLNPTQVLIPVPAEIVTNREIGLRSDWLDGRLRFNATYFDALWEGMRVTNQPTDALGNSQPFPYQSGEGEGIASGFEFEVVWLPTDRLQLNLGLGLIDTEYIEAGLFDGNSGNRPGSPFAYAADSATLGAQYEVPLSNGGRVVLIGNYGFMDDYARDSAYQRTLIDADGNPVLEPAYGILNSRVVYEPAARNYSVELWGKNLLDERYFNGGYDARGTWGYDFGIVGRAREVGVGINFEF